MRLAATLLALTAAYCSPPAFAQTQGLRVAPILIQMTQDHPLSSFRVHNGRDHETAFQVDVFAWSQEDGRDVLTQAPWVEIFPGLAIAITVLAFNLIGDGLRERLDPRGVTR